jgi:6-pyruvoyltetrahydropterin/6-carboxytetrahydropterin synthase
MYRIGKRFRFEAAHRLEELPAAHKCARLHGHSYVVEVVVAADRLTGAGFVTDFADLSPVGDYLAAAFDHRVLNDRLGAGPTSERLAHHLFEWCAGNLRLPAEAAVEVVRVAETTSAWAEYRPEPTP